MIGDAIRLVLTNSPTILFVAAFVCAWLVASSESFPARLLSWLLLLSVGVENVWFGCLHMALPGISAATIGWEPSPFEFEIGAADMALGVIAVVSFWRSLDFKAAVVIYVTLFYLGVAAIHIQEAAMAGNFAPNNFGMLLILTLIKMVLLPLLYWNVRRAAREATARA
jgi:hypothetical protein